MILFRDLICYDIKPYYMITEDGKIYSKFYNKFLQVREDKDGYLSLLLCCNDEKRRHFRVHRLVASTYLENPDNLPIVMHLDNNSKNNHYSNLRWGTISENTQQAFDDGLVKNIRQVELLDLDSNIVKEFMSVSECCRYFGYKQGSETRIIRMCEGRHPNPAKRGAMKNYIVRFK